MDYDSLRTLFEQIRDERRTAANTAQRIGKAFLALLDAVREFSADNFLSRVKPDTAQGHITFADGLTSSKSVIAQAFSVASKWLRNIVRSSDPLSNDGEGADDALLSERRALQTLLRKDRPETLTHLLTLVGGLSATDVETPSIHSSDFQTGEGGAGFAIREVGGHMVLEIDDIVARRKLTVSVLDVQRTMFSQGRQVLTNANGTIERVVALDEDLQPTGQSMFGFSADGNFYVLTADSKALGDTQGLLATAETMAEAYAYKLYFRASDETRTLRDYWRCGDLALCREFNIAERTDPDTDISGSPVYNHAFHRLVLAHGTEEVDGKTYIYIIVSNAHALASSKVPVRVMLPLSGNEADAAVYPHDITAQYFSLDGENALAAWSFDGSLPNTIPAVGDDVVHYGSVLDAARRGATSLSPDAAGGILTHEKGIGGIILYEPTVTDPDDGTIYDVATELTLTSMHQVVIDALAAWSARQFLRQRETLHLGDDVSIEANSFFLTTTRGGVTESRPVPYVVDQVFRPGVDTAHYYEQWTYDGQQWLCRALAGTTATPSETSPDWLLVTRRGNDGAAAVRRWIEWSPSALHVDADGACTDESPVMQFTFFSQEGAAAPVIQEVADADILLTLSMVTASGQRLSFAGTLAEFIEAHSGASDPFNGFIENHCVYPLLGDVIGNLTLEWGLDSLATSTLPTVVDGKDGDNGHSPVVTIGPNGNWFIDGVDTGEKAQGEQGDPGAPGSPGADGLDAWLISTNPSLLIIEQGLQRNQDGSYAYDADGRLIPIVAPAVGTILLQHGNATATPSSIALDNHQGSGPTSANISASLSGNSLTVTLSATGLTDNTTEGAVYVVVTFVDEQGATQERHIEIPIHINRLGSFLSETIGDVTHELRERTAQLYDDEGNLKQVYYRSDWTRDSQGLTARLSALETSDQEQSEDIAALKITARELESDYTSLSNGLQTANSKIQQNAQKISTEVSRLDGAISTVEQTADSLNARVTGSGYIDVWPDANPRCVASTYDVAQISGEYAPQGETQGADFPIDWDDDDQPIAWLLKEVTLEKGVTYRLNVVAAFDKSEGLERVVVACGHVPTSGQNNDLQSFEVSSALPQRTFFFTPLYTGTYFFKPWYIPSTEAMDREMDEDVSTTVRLEWLKLDAPAIPSVASFQMEADRISMGVEGMAGANILQQTDWRTAQLADLSQWILALRLNGADQGTDEQKALVFTLARNAYERFTALHIEKPETTAYDTAALWQSLNGRLKPNTQYTLSFRYRSTNPVFVFLQQIRNTAKPTLINGEQYAANEERNDIANQGNPRFPSTSWLWQSVTISFYTPASLSGTQYLGFNAYAWDGTKSAARNLEIVNPKLELGAVATPWSDLPDVLRRTGVDIEQGKVVATADNFEVRNNAGEKTFGVDAEGNLTATGGAKFAGTIEAKVLYTTNARVPFTYDADISSFNRQMSADRLLSLCGGRLPQRLVFYSDDYRTEIDATSNIMRVYLPDAYDYEGMEMEVIFPGLYTVNSNKSLEYRVFCPQSYKQVDTETEVETTVALPLPFKPGLWRVDFEYVYPSEPYQTALTSCKLRLLASPEVTGTTKIVRWMILEMVGCTASQYNP